MSKARVPLAVAQQESTLSVPLGSLTVTATNPSGGRPFFTLTGEQLAELVSFAKAHQYSGLIDRDSINMELRGLAALARYAGASETRYVDEEYAFMLIEKVCESMAARLEADPDSARDYIVTIDRQAVA